MVDDSSGDRDPVEVLAEEFVERLRKGERPSIAEYKSRYPNLAEDIEDIFPALAMMDEIDPSAGELSQSEPAKDDILPKLEKLGDFRIIREVGRGGMGVVYEAEQVSLGRHVALKVLPASALPDNKHVRRFEREAKSAAKLHHTNIVPVFGVGQQEELHYYVMQFIQGLPLDEVIDELKKIHARPTETITSSVPAERTGQHQRQQSVADVAHSLMTGQFAETQIGKNDSDIESSADNSERSDSSASRSSETLNLSGSLSGSTLKIGKSGVHSAPSKIQTYWESVAHIGLQVADALQYAHEQNILHRDIKPSNLLLDLRGTTWVTDFGLAKATDQQDITHTGDILGTLRYMPPEAFDGIADARSDIYSLGLTLYELLAFQPAFGVKDRHQLIKQVTTEIAPRLDKLNPQIPRDLVTIVHKAIDRDRSHRYQTAQEMQEDLQRFLEDEPIKARRISLTERLVRWSRRNKGLATSLATVCVLLLIINIVGPWMYLLLQDEVKKGRDLIEK
ncbi:MAG TPA: serine/threonine-protein kinase, partial [Planctomycetaceae bacterium]|nr:serine/threonine-protein kinase [Planctomycetaceae bacterium]